jgi:hypothetical protein
MSEKEDKILLQKKKDIQNAKKRENYRKRKIKIELHNEKVRKWVILNYGIYKSN